MVRAIGCGHVHLTILPLSCRGRIVGWRWPPDNSTPGGKGYLNTLVHVGYCCLWATIQQGEVFTITEQDVQFQCSLHYWFHSLLFDVWQRSQDAHWYHVWNTRARTSDGVRTCHNTMPEPRVCLWIQLYLCIGPLWHHTLSSDSVFLIKF